jgi:hypothetical protein
VAQKQVLGHQIPAGAQYGGQRGEQEDECINYAPSMSRCLSARREVSPPHRQESIARTEIVDAGTGGAAVPVDERVDVDELAVGVSRDPQEFTDVEAVPSVHLV